jgi:site-specific DNA-methyltransferase (adenine-specific)
VWVKITKDGKIRPDGIGRYTPNNVEIVLLGKKGKYWRESKYVKQVILAPKTKHSEKPKEVYQRIKELFGDLSRIELFARQKTEGWDAWGLEVPKETQKELRIESS